MVSYITATYTVWHSIIQSLPSRTRTGCDYDSMCHQPQTLYFTTYSCLSRSVIYGYEYDNVEGMLSAFQISILDQVRAVFDFPRDNLHLVRCFLVLTDRARLSRLCPAWSRLSSCRVLAGGTSIILGQNYCCDISSVYAYV